MRVISGKYKGYRFNPPSNLPARPTTDRTKEALFNILQSMMDLENCRALDLFSGTGNIAYEMASHGAISITAIEQHYPSVTFIKSIFQNLEFKDFKVIKADVFKWMKQYSGDGFDLIFADPPYDLLEIHKIPEMVFELKILNPDGILIIEHRKSFGFVSENLLQTREYGQSQFSFFQVNK